MDNDDFAPNWSNWQRLYQENRKSYNKKEPWANTGKHPLDLLFEQLAYLYINALPKQKLQIERYFIGKANAVWELNLYTRRLGEIIYFHKNATLITVGFAIAEIVVKRIDNRDLIVSMVIMRYGAERANIEIASYYESAIDEAPMELRRLLENVYHHPTEAIERTVDVFGPPTW